RLMHVGPACLPGRRQTEQHACQNRKDGRILLLQPHSDRFHFGARLVQAHTGLEPRQAEQAGMIASTLPAFLTRKRSARFGKANPAGMTPMTVKTSPSIVIA